MLKSSELFLKLLTWLLESFAHPFSRVVILIHILTPPTTTATKYFIYLYLFYPRKELFTK